MTWIQTFSGEKFEPFSPDISTINIEDIAHSLSMLCRFNGHCQRFYSVAEHSVNVSLIVPPEYALQALLHDAAEVYVSDVPYPIKATVPAFEKAEQKVFDIIAEKFGIYAELSKIVHEADKIMLATEQQQIMSTTPEKWPNMPEPRSDIKLECLAPSDAKQLFLKKFDELKTE